MNRRLSILMPRIAVVCPRWAQAPRGTVVLVVAWLASVAAFARTTNTWMDSRTVIAAGPLSTLVLPSTRMRTCKRTERACPTCPSAPQGRRPLPA